MKVIERKPLRQRGRNADKRKATKEAIRDVYMSLFNRLSLGL